MKTIAHVLAASSVLIGLVGLAGCREATNEPSAAEIQQSQERRAAAIDADTTLTPEGKEKMKEMLHIKKGNTPEQKR